MVTEIKSANITPVTSSVAYADRVKQNGHVGAVLWFSGLSASGKSTLAQEFQKKLFMQDARVYVLDGDNIRSGLNCDLGFSAQDRSENLRRVAEVAKLFANSGMIVIAAFISPYEKDRKLAKSICQDYFHSIYIKAPISICEQRDPKGLYQKARQGEIKNFTGLDDKYEEPLNPDLIIDTKLQTIEESVENLLTYVRKSCF